MGLWQTFEKRNNTKDSAGFSLHFDSETDPRIKKEFMHFAQWMRKKYVFPLHIHIYILNCETLTLRDGSTAYGSFRWYPHRPPYIRIPAKPEASLLEQFSYEDICEQILSSLVHELTHYFQWLARPQQTDAVSERQANYYRYRIIEKYYRETGG